jgi:hypothetical protein
VSARYRPILYDPAANFRFLLAKKRFVRSPQGILLFSCCACRACTICASWRSRRLNFTALRPIRCGGHIGDRVPLVLLVFLWRLRILTELVPEQKKKCDETRPSCSRCTERGLDCAYETVKPRQRRKRESSASGTTTSSLLTRIKTEFPSSRRYSDGSDDSNDSQVSPTARSWPPAAGDQPIVDEVICDGDDLTPMDSTFDVQSHVSYPTEATALSPIGSTACSDFLPIQPRENDDEQKPMVNSAPIVARRNTHLGIVAPFSPARSRYPDLAMISPVPTMSPLLEFQAPAFSEFSEKTNRRALVDHFCNVLSHLIVFREETGNPFQQLVLPLTRRSLPVMNAIYALASAHLEYRGVDIGGEKSIYFHNQAIQGLARLIEHDDKARRDELLAAIMLLVYYEVVCKELMSIICKRR